MKSMSLDCIKSTAAVIIAMLRSFENSSITNAGLFDWPAAADKVSGWLQCCSTAVDAAAVLVAQPKTGDNCTAAVGDILQPAVCPSRHQATPGWWEERAGHHSADSVAAAAACI